ncbi:MAG: ribosomal protein S18-alanine N-acetyltransferase [Deltaproteobacteria bacterium]|nr:ribosomal protein S18-alanine N-acetyltransferase [Deltaproteobacteria bacterium]
MNNLDLKSIDMIDLDKRYIAEIVDIEKKSFAHPWTKESFLQIFEQKNYAGLGILLRKKLIGYCFFYWAVDELSIVNIAIDPDFRGKNMGTTLLASVEDQAKKLHCQTIFLEVSVTNATAQKLYQKLGYSKQALRVGYYTDGKDALVMRKKL